MTFAPESLRDLAAYWGDHGGANLGIVGDEDHTKGYHLGRDRIYDGSGPGLGDLDYSVRLERDRAGLTNAASAIDFGRLDGRLADLQDFSRWLVRECQRGAPGSSDVREVIYSPDGSHVQRYSGVDGKIHTGAGNGNAGHLTHTHVSYFRDSEDRDKRGLVRGYFEGDGDMSAIVWYPIAGEGDGVVTLKEGRGLVDLITGRRYVPADTVKESRCRISAVDIGDGYLVRDAGHGCLALDDACDFTPRDPADPDQHDYVIRITTRAESIAITATQDGEPIA